jgi:hypothetical protein
MGEEHTVFKFEYLVIRRLANSRHSRAAKFWADAATAGCDVTDQLWEMSIFKFKYLVIRRLANLRHSCAAKFWADAATAGCDVTKMGEEHI